MLHLFFDLRINVGMEKDPQYLNAECKIQVDTIRDAFLVKGYLEAKYTKEGWLDTWPKNFELYADGVKVGEL